MNRGQNIQNILSRAEKQFSTNLFKPQRVFDKIFNVETGYLKWLPHEEYLRNMLGASQVILITFGHRGVVLVRSL